MVEQTERLGVSKTDFYFSSKGWLFREQMVHDYGIDAHVEIVNDSYPTGDLIAIQIKSGMSFFLKSQITHIYSGQKISISNIGQIIRCQ